MTKGRSTDQDTTNARMNDAEGANTLESMIECARARTYGFVLQQGYPAIESDAGTGLHRDVGALAFEVRAPSVVMMMLVFVQSAVRVENVVQHRGIRRHGSLCRRGRFGGYRVRRQRQLCNRIYTKMSIISEFTEKRHARTHAIQRALFHPVNVPIPLCRSCPRAKSKSA